MSQYPEISFETKILERLELGVTTALSNYLLAGIQGVKFEASRELGFIRDEMVLRLRAHVWADPEKSHKKTHTFTYEEAHPTWQHALVSSLPEDSFRRRWAHFFWDIPLDYRKTKVTQRIEVNVPAVLPEMQRQYPPEMGRIMFPISITPQSVTREQFYVR